MTILDKCINKFKITTYIIINFNLTLNMTNPLDKKLVEYVAILNPDKNPPKLSRMDIFTESESTKIISELMKLGKFQSFRNACLGIAVLCQKGGS